METSESNNNNNNNSESSKNEKDKNENLSNVLWMMAEKCLQANQIIQAIQCLEAIIQSEEIRFSPTIVIKTRVRLAEILLTYTENYEEALHHLNKAIFIAKDNPAAVELQLQILYHMLACYKVKNSQSLAKQMVRKGLSLLQMGANIEDRVEWHSFFQLHMANIHRKEGALNSILECLENGLTYNMNNLKYQLLFMMTKAHYYLLQWDHSNTYFSLTECQKIINQLTSPTPISDYVMVHSDLKSKPESDSVATISFLKLHNSILSLLYLIRLGEFKTANIELNKMHEFCQQIDLTEPLFYTWLPTVNLFSIIYLISVICHKNSSNIPNAITICSKALELINTHLTQTFGTEYLVHVRKVDHIYDLLRIKFLFIENSCYMNLTQCNFSAALKNIAQILQLHKAAPTIFNKFLSVIHILIALYAQAVGYPYYSVLHLERAMQSTSIFEIQGLCIIHLCIIYLRSGAMDKVVHILNPNRRRLENHPSLALKASTSFLVGVLAYLRGSSSDAKSKLRDCLQIANNPLSNSQLTAHTLNFLGELFLTLNILDQAYNMLHASLVLSFNTGDIATQLHTLRLFGVLYLKTGDQSNQTSNFQYFQKRISEHSERVNAARALAENNCLQQFLDEVDKQNQNQNQNQTQVQTQTQTQVQTQAQVQTQTQTQVQT